MGAITAHPARAAWQRLARTAKRRATAWLPGMLGAMAIAPLPSLSAIPRPLPAVHVEAGWLEGLRESGVTVWRGIPYAAAPVGDLRWRAPQPAANFGGTLKAHAFGPACPQVAESPTQLSPLGPQSEDCLTLNIWAPASASAGKRKLPVMVWLHGGGFIAGTGAEAQFDGAALARQGVIVVTLNYRLGRLGFFAHPALSAEHPEEPHGNYGLLDQLAALRWVKANIAGFGGDPGNVTLFGESAGAISTVFLMAASSAKGLFHKVIVQSAPLGTPLRDLREDRPDAPSAETLGRQWAASLGIAGEDSAALAALRRLPVEQVAPRSTTPAEIYAIMSMSRPMQDGALLLGDPAAIHARGEQIAVPMIVGSNGPGPHRQFGVQRQRRLCARVLHRGLGPPCLRCPEAGHLGTGQRADERGVPGQRGGRRGGDLQRDLHGDHDQRQRRDGRSDSAGSRARHPAPARYRPGKVMRTSLSARRCG